MDFKKEFLKELKENGKTKSWEDYATEYLFKNGETARCYWKKHRPKIGQIAKKVEELSEKVNMITGERQIQFTSDKALTIDEVKNKFNVDDITTTISTYWCKEQSNGRYLISALIKVNPVIADLYEGLEESLKKVFPKQIPTMLPIVNTSGDKTLIVTIADDHAGLEFDTSMHGDNYSGSIYAKRLVKVVNEIKQLQDKFDKVIVLRLGDELNGLNQTTSRGGHSVDSLSNKKQFEIFCVANRIFYNDLFQSGIAQNYEIHYTNNSNHCGLGFSFIANTALQYFIEGAFPQVQHFHSDEFIKIIEIDNHKIGITHGYDDTYRKKAMPYVLNTETDLYLCEFFNAKGFNPQTNWITLIKADLHRTGLSDGKFGRYINCPAVGAGSKWIETNFGRSKPASLLFVFDTNKKYPQLIEIDLI